MEGKIQRSPEGVVHLVAERMIDRTQELNRLTEDEPKRASAADNQMPEAFAGEVPSRFAAENATNQFRHPRQVRAAQIRDYH